MKMMFLEIEIIPIDHFVPEVIIKSFNINDEISTLLISTIGMVSDWAPHNTLRGVNPFKTAPITPKYANKNAPALAVSPR